jgi:hypothetical protein
MICIYIDESGDLGFKFKKTKPPSYFYTISAIVVSGSVNDNKLKRIVKKIRQKKLKKKYKKKDELKFSNTNNTIRKAVLNEIIKLDVSIYSLTINKKRVTNNLRNKPDILNNYIMKELLDECLSGDLGKPIHIHIDRHLPKNKQEELYDYITWTFAERLNKSPKVEFNHDDSKGNKAIQAVDFIAGAIQQRYENGNSEYYTIIKHKLKHKEYFMK